ncbi:hypothetical protein LU293_03415 [Moraxella nasovis]|uniref:hypothetical protein n=1 Tax=Moraxella nasovis TaxID=2904121 RepID=UPI001F60AE0E|nr:hypothetical protein [Moraxella nasovis]UNU73958.1 hypothetical protein LU293_03415 [Moraxella nasovis]
MKLIGNKDIYLEVDIVTYCNNMAHLVLIIGNTRIGTLDSPTYIPSFIASLESLLLENVYFYENMNIDVFTKMALGGELENKNAFTLEDTFDDFMKRCIRSKDNLYFYFKLYTDHFFEYKNIDVNVPIIKIISVKNFDLFLSDIKYFFNNINMY